jgi:hypothetical protein
MDTPLRIAEAVQQACIAAALRAYEDAGLSGLCHEGRWECAVDAMRGIDLQSLVQALLQQRSTAVEMSGIGYDTRNCSESRGE